jgi:invasion protein IalB
MTDGKSCLFAGFSINTLAFHTARKDRFMRLSFLTLLACTALTAAVKPAVAQEFFSSYGNWHVFTVQKGGEKLCYMASEPVKRSGGAKRSGSPYLMITSRSDTVDEVSASSGYSYKQDSKVQIETGKTKFEFFTRDDLAWAYDTEQDSRLVNAMKKGHSVTVRGTPAGKGSSQDTYSLQGVGAAYKKMKSECNG